MARSYSDAAEVVARCARIVGRYVLITSCKDALESLSLRINVCKIHFISTDSA